MLAAAALRARPAGPQAGHAESGRVRPELKGRGGAPLRAQLFRNVGIDSAMNNAYARISAHVCFPPLVVTPNEHATSTIQESP